MSSLLFTHFSTNIYAGIAMIGWGSDVNTAHRPAYVREKGRCERGKKRGRERGVCV
jgi:hypothetical protein